MRLRAAWIVSMFCALFSLACGDSNKSPSTIPPPAAEHVAIAEAFCKTYWQFRCAQMTECACGVSDLETCIEGNQAICRSQILAALTDASLDVEVDEGAVEACRSELARFTDCSPLPEVPPACLKIPRSTTALCVDGLGCGTQGFCRAGQCFEPLPQGADCSGPGLFCDDGLRCDGVCVTPGPEGASCESDRGCAPGLSCYAELCRSPGGEAAPCDLTMPCGPGLRCLDSICEPAAEPCDMNEGESCGVFATCREPSSRECRPMGNIGASCEESTQCAYGQWCERGRCVQAAERGEPCSDGVWCEAGLACLFPEFVCSDIPGPGDDCALTLYGPSYCGPGLGCSAGLCAALPQKDEPCTLDSRCAQPWGCSFERNGSFCRERRGAGGACENDHICADGTFCDYRKNRCAPIYTSGSECALGNECGRERACLPAGNKFVCSDLPGGGQPCLDTCASGFECVTLRLAPRCVSDVCLPAGTL